VSTNIFWYISRTAALAAYVIFFFNIFLGLGMKLKFLEKVWAKWQSADLHQFTALLGMALILVHIFSLSGDTYYKYTLPQLLVPFASPYRAVWTTWGVLGFYAAVIVTLSCYLRKFIGQRTWRKIHLVSFGLFWAIFFHSIKAGTDTSLPWVKSMYIVTGVIISFLFLLRLSEVLFPAEQKEAKLPVVLSKESLDNKVS
jgi:predicted ferric reductase